MSLLKLSEQFINGEFRLIFQCGTISGEYDWDAHSIKILSIVNESLGNGDFQHFMDELHKDQQNNIEWHNVDNYPLYKHLFKKWGYLPHAEGFDEYGLKLIKPVEEFQLDYKVALERKAITQIAFNEFIAN